MTLASRPILLRAYIAATRSVPLFATPLLKRRLAKGKEDPNRWTEKCGQASLPRANGPLIWLHGVGLGEVMALRGLITLMAKSAPTAHFLVTSTTTKGAQAFGRNLPPRTMHQYLPLDTPRYRRAFLDHWQPDLCIWTEQDIWPGFITDLHDRDIPQALIGGRMHTDSFKRHRRAEALFASLFERLALVRAQDAESAMHYNALGAKGATVNVPLKPSAPPLTCDANELTILKSQIGKRPTWIVAPSHPNDETIAYAAHNILLKTQPDALLIIAPRFSDRSITPPFPTAIRSNAETPSTDQSVWLADTHGELGLFYRLASHALIGGTHSDIEGHNPWEAIALDLAVLHGPHTKNFASDFKLLSDNKAVKLAGDPATLASLLANPLADQRKRANDCLISITHDTQTLVDDLLSLLK